MAIRIENIFGSFELRRPVRPGEDSAVSFNLPDRALEQALRQAVDWHPGAAWDLIDQLGEFSPRIVADPELMVGVLVKALRWGRLVLAREGSESDDPADRSWAAYRTFVALFGREFRVGMRAHRLVSRESAIEIRREADYDVVPAAEAQDLIKRVVKSVRGSAMPQPQLDELSHNIVDLRSPSGQGFVLLRAPQARAARSVATADIVTPSQLRDIVERKERGWIAIQLSDQEGHPLGKCPVEVEDAEGATFTGALDSKGYIRFDGVSPKGPARIRFNKLPNRSGELAKGTGSDLEPSNRRTETERLAVVPGGPCVLGEPGVENRCCLIQPIMTIVYLIPGGVGDLEHAQYVLRSTDGRYENVKSSTDDLVPGDAFLQIEFDELLVDAVYDLTRLGIDESEERCFEGRTFMEIVDQPRGSAFERLASEEEEQSPQPFKEAFAWIDEDGLGTEGFA